jgi:hypothetical protein
MSARYAAPASTGDYKHETPQHGGKPVLDEPRKYYYLLVTDTKPQVPRILGCQCCCPA